MTVQIGVVVFPGSNCDRDTAWALARAGVIARLSPIKRAVAAFAAQGGHMLGICNGFQVLAEAGLVPGALLRNRSLRFVCREVVVTPDLLGTPFRRALADRRALRLPIAPGEGCYHAEEATLDALERNGQVWLRCVRPDGRPAIDPDDPTSPDGSLRAIAGVTNAAGNAAGLMPYPERAAEALLGSADRMLLLRSLVEAAGERAAAGGSVAAGAGHPR